MDYTSCFVTMKYDIISILTKLTRNVYFVNLVNITNIKSDII